MFCNEHSDDCWKHILNIHIQAPPRDLLIS